MSTMDQDRLAAREIALRGVSKRLLDPAITPVASRRFWHTAAIRHIGRRSGTTYTTPVMADRVGQDFIIPLPSGTRTNWLRNVLAAGRATLSVRGVTYEVMAPRIIDKFTALPQVPAAHRRFWRRLRIDQYLQVTIRANLP
jgi:deazaflavin-dependent oxidoreductase (nitroreductase family)